MHAFFPVRFDPLFDIRPQHDIVDPPVSLPGSGEEFSRFLCYYGHGADPRGRFPVGHPALPFQKGILSRADFPRNPPCLGTPGIPHCRESAWDCCFPQARDSERQNGRIAGIYPLFVGAYDTEHRTGLANPFEVRRDSIHAGKS